MGSILRPAAHWRLGSSRLEIARRLGADHVVDFRTGDPVERIMAITQGRGVDVANEALGTQGTFASAVRVLRPGGTLSSLAESVVEATVADMGIEGLQSPVRLLRARVAHLPAREIRKVTEEAVARASANGRYAVVLTDLPAWLLAEDGLRLARQLH